MEDTTTQAAATAAGTDAGTAAAGTPPSPSESSAAASAGNTAPPANAARDAYDRLAQGADPRQVNQHYKAAEQQKPAAKRADATPAKKDKPGQPQRQQPDAQDKDGAATPASSSWPDSLSKADRQVLSRAQLDPDTWAAIPPSNQKKVLDGLRKTQAAQDRAFQQQRAAAGTKGKDAPAAGGRPQPQSPPDPRDQGNHGDEQTDGTGVTDPADDAAEGSAPGADEQTATPPSPSAPVSPTASLIPAATRATLEALGGSELADSIDQAVNAAVGQQQAQSRQMLGVLEFLLSRHIDGEFNSTVRELATQIGMDGLKPDHADYGKNAQALRTKAMYLHRAAGDPQGYPFTEAVKDAAASLFKTTTQQAIQARLAQGIRTSIQGSPDRGDGRREQRGPMTAQQRGRAAYELLAQGLAPGQVAQQVDTLA